MKNSLLKFSLVLTISIALISFSSCKKDDQDNNNNNNTSINSSNLTGTWTMSSSEVDMKAGGMNIIDYMVNTLGYSQQQAQTINDFMMTSFKNSFTGTVTFNSDNTYFVDTPEDDENGTWALSGDGKTLTLTHDEGTDNLSVVSYNSNTLVLDLPTETEMVDFDGDDIEETNVTMDVRLTLTK